uniref:Uncharacterized protein n=1 Tax=Chenopodium quinoa TaxID=63459 RepID=A0A803MH02_CHEQI
MAKEVMKTHDAVFCNRPILMVAKEVFYDCTDVGLAPYGECWAEHTKDLNARTLHFEAGRVVSTDSSGRSYYSNQLLSFGRRANC